jgi:hypothetical protein
MLQTLIVTAVMLFQAGIGNYWKDIERVQCTGNLFGYTTLQTNVSSRYLHANTTSWSVNGTVNQTTLQFSLFTLDPGKAGIESILVDGLSVNVSHFDPFTDKLQTYSVDTNATIPHDVAISVVNYNAGKTVYVGLACIQIKVLFTTFAESASTGASATASSSDPLLEASSDEDLYDSAEIFLWFFPAVLIVLAAAILVAIPTFVHKYKAPPKTLVNEEATTETYVRKAQLQTRQGYVNVATVFASQTNSDLPDIKSPYLCPWLGTVNKRGRTYDVYAIGEKVRLERAMYSMERGNVVIYPLKWMVKICKGLQELHSHGMVHGNVVPDCVWIDLETNSASLCDYRDPRRRSAITIQSDIFDLGNLIEYVFHDLQFYTDHGCDAFVAECKNPEPKKRPSLEACEQTLKAYIRTLKAD